MKQFFKYFFASLLALVVAGALFFFIFFSIIGSITSSITAGLSPKEEEAVVDDKSILRLDLTKPISEIGEINSFSIFSNSNSASPGLFELLHALNYAKTDPAIKGLYIRLGGTPNGWATLNEVKNAIADFKASGKFVYTYSEMYTQKDIYVAAEADSVFLNPIGLVEVKGLAANIMFFKGTLDKLDIQPEIFYCGKYKSATEPFRMHKMSDENRIQQAAMLQEYWEELSAQIQKKAKVDAATVNQWAQNASIQTTQDVINHGLVDRLCYRDEVEDALKNRVGIDVSKKLGMTKIEDYFKTIPKQFKTDRIAILVAQGDIIDGDAQDVGQIASNDFIKEIRKIRDNKNFKAVVLRVNSPGGSAFASEEIYRELELLKKEKKLVVSFGNYAASGGYYIAAMGDSIFSLSNTLTGSIGVFGMLFNVSDFLNKKLGVTSDVEKTAPYADFPNLGRPLSATEKGFIQRSVDTTYMIFKRRVATGRNKSIEYIDSIGQGRVWTGKKALELGLVDAIGGIKEAVQAAADLANISDYSVHVYPEAEDKMARLFKTLGNAQEGQIKMAEKVLEATTGELYQTGKMVQQLIRNPNNVWMMTPGLPYID